MTAHLLTLCATMMLAIDHPALCEPPRDVGYLSAYSERPTLATIAYRQAHGQIPNNLSGYDGVIAVADCSRIGQDAILHTEANGYRVFRLMVFDCASEVDGGAVWMRDNHIVGEVGFGFWQRYPELVHGWGEVVYR